MALELEKILGTDTGKEAFYKTDRNFQKICDGIGNIDVSEDIQAHNTDETAHDDIRERINTLDANKANKDDFIQTEYVSNVVLNGGYVFHAATKNSFKKYGNNLVVITCTITGTFVAGEEVVIGTIPTEIRPSGHVINTGNVVAGSQIYNARVQIKSDGSIVLQSGGSASGTMPMLFTYSI